MTFEVHAETRVGIPLPAAQGQWWPGAVSGEPGGETPVLMRDADGVLWTLVGPGIQRLELSGPAPSRSRVDLRLPLRPARVVAAHDDDRWSIDGLDAEGVPGPALQLSRPMPEGGASPESRVLEPGVLPPLLRVIRTLQLGLDWRVKTEVVRLSPVGTPLAIAVPLIDGEAVTTAGMPVERGRVRVRLDADATRIEFDSRLEPRDQVLLTAPADPRWTEEWRMDVAPIWSVDYRGIPAVHHRDGGGAWLPTFLPWPGESVTMTVTRPAGVSGPQLTIDRSVLSVVPGARAVDSEMQLDLRASRGLQHGMLLPESAELRAVAIDGKTQPVRQSGREVLLPIDPGTRSVTLSWREPRTPGWHFETPRVSLGTSSVNHAITVEMPRDRWILFLTGPLLGPAVLFWSLLIVVLLLAVGLGRSRITPLRSGSWLLLGIGLTQVPVGGAALIVAWLLALGVRERLGPIDQPGRHNLVQVGLALLTLLALSLLFDAVSRGLLGYPSMQIAGNDSTAYRLNWYQDRAPEIPARAGVFSVPLWVYRAVMLAWALWLAFALLGWLRWGWSVLSRDGLWRRLELAALRWRSRRKGAGGDATPPASTD